MWDAGESTSLGIHLLFFSQKKKTFFFSFVFSNIHCDSMKFGGLHEFSFWFSSEHSVWSTFNMNKVWRISLFVCELNLRFLIQRRVDLKCIQWKYYVSILWKLLHKFTQMFNCIFQFIHILHIFYLSQQRKRGAEEKKKKKKLRTILLV